MTVWEIIQGNSGGSALALDTKIMEIGVRPLSLFGGRVAAINATIVTAPLPHMLQPGCDYARPWTLKI